MKMLAKLDCYTNTKKKQKQKQDNNKCKCKKLVWHIIYTTVKCVGDWFES